MEPLINPNILDSLQFHIWFSSIGPSNLYAFYKVVLSLEILQFNI